MRLKRVKIFGFKTFADKTEFDLDGNIISVIGPNGCGKSNIVDAILWGLGESNARNLRAQTAKEVIFSGSGVRKPQGYAEVSLLFDNEDGVLPVDSAEVSVTRRLTRAGESDYAINKRNCRLRDVNDLLADSGLGKAGYAIVSQSDIDQALSASAQQRRGWIDEAAGVQRYRARRTEAVRRLEHAEDHVKRVKDIILEIEQQMAPLEAEAESAKRYKTVLTSLREVECGLLVKELAQAVSDLAELEERITSAMKLAEGEAARAEVLERESRGLAEEAGRLETRIELLREAQTKAQGAYEQALATVQVAEHKLAHLDELEKSIGEESGLAGERLEAARAELERAREEEANERESLERLREELAGAGGEAKALAAELTAVEKELNEARRVRAERQKFELEEEHRRTRIRQIRKELQGIADALPDLQAAVASAESDAGAVQAQIQEAKGRAAQAEQGLAELRRREEEKGAKSRQLLAQIAALDGKRRGIESTIEAHEGLAQGPRAVMAAVSQGMLSGEYVPVGEAVTVEPDLAQAIDTALGGAANDLIVPDEGHAKRAIQVLKEHRMGRATFQPIPLMRPVDKSMDLRQVLVKDGVVGLASELVECEGRFRPVIDSLLGRVVVVEDIDVALGLARTRGWSRLVTLDGEVVFSSGAVSGGASQRQGSGMVQRKAELGEVIEELERLQADLNRFQSGGGDESAREAAIAARDAARAEIEELGSGFEEARAWFLNLKHELQTTLNDDERLKKELAQLSEGGGFEGEEGDLEALEGRRDEVMKQLAAKSSNAGQASERLQEAEMRAGQSRTRRSEAEARLESLEQADALRQRRAENLDPDRERFRLQIAEGRTAVEAEERKVTELRSQVMEAIEGRKSLLAESQAKAEEARSARQAASATGDVLHQSELKRARADSKRTAAIERLVDEYGIVEDEALAQAESVEVPEDAASLVANLRKELKGMGEVNLGAIEAFERLNERHQELFGQIEDIEGGMGEIQASIKEMDRLTREKFVATFDKLREAFAHTFVKLFGGGEGNLELSEAESILDSGVDISVQIPGKRRQRLELLSGGERAMSALAFLFALLKVKPTPLVVLDEVDAPLDGRNVERFVAMMREFNEQTQFILITHNPVTIESADVWFGVTMQEPGVSTLVPFKVPPKGPVQEAGLAVVSGEFSAAKG